MNDLRIRNELSQFLNVKLYEIAFKNAHLSRMNFKDFHLLPKAKIIDWQGDTKRLSCVVSSHYLIHDYPEYVPILSKLEFEEFENTETYFDLLEKDYGSNLDLNAFTPRSIKICNGFYENVDLKKTIVWTAGIIMMDGSNSILISADTYWNMPSVKISLQESIIENWLNLLKPTIVELR
jgi:hypothetical protein